jgi:hypothetical protein
MVLQHIAANLSAYKIERHIQILCLERRSCIAKINKKWRQNLKFLLPSPILLLSELSQLYHFQADQSWFDSPDLTEQRGVGSLFLLGIVYISRRERFSKVPKIRMDLLAYNGESRSTFIPI